MTKKKIILPKEKKIILPKENKIILPKNFSNAIDDIFEQNKKTILLKNKVVKNLDKKKSKENIYKPRVVWEENPLTFEEWVQHKNHANFQGLSKRQIAGSQFLFGENPKEAFNNGRYMSILEWGKGCVGKETKLQDAFTQKKYTIDQLIKLKKQIYIQCYNEIKKQKTIELASVPWKRGSGEMYFVETEFGHKIRVYKHHKFLTKNGWKKLSQIKIGEEILDDLSEEYINNTKQKLLKKYNWKGKNKQQRGILQSKYFKELYDILGKDYKKRFGMQKENHPLWGKKHSEETKLKNKISNKITFKKIYSSERGDLIRKKISLKTSGKNNPMFGRNAPIGSGKCKYYKINNLNNELQYVQGKWELEFAQFLNFNNINWEKNKDRFNYKYNNIEHTYCPDFKLFFNKEYIYIEIKGIESKETQAKIKSVMKQGKKIYKIGGDIFTKYYLNEKYKNKDIKWVKIKSIIFDKIDDYYDLSVEKYHNYLAHGVYNHNSGKDTVSRLNIQYSVYLLLCCENPWDLFYGIQRDSTIDCINVARDAKQSSAVFFKSLVNSIKNWKWLKDRYKIVVSGKSKYFQEDIKKIKDEVRIVGEEIRFPKEIVAVSSNSEAEAAEGRNTLLSVLDEFSAFKSSDKIKSNAMAMFNALRSSSTTRFENFGKMMVISYPRYKDDPIESLIEMYRDDPGVFIDKGSTFDIKPRHCFKSAFVPWVDESTGISYEIPKSFLTEFEKKPEDSKTKYLCLPPDSEDPFFTLPQKIDECVSQDRIPLFNVEQLCQKKEGIRYISQIIVKQNYNIPNAYYNIGLDLGEVKDRAILSLFHTEKKYNDRIKKMIDIAVQDLLVIWKPDKKKKTIVDFDNVEDFILELVYKYKLQISSIRIDKWQSVHVKQTFNKISIPTEIYTLREEDFLRIRSHVYSNEISYLNIDYQIREMKRLINTDSGKPDHPSNYNNEEGHDDSFRANCLAIRQCLFADDIHSGHRIDENGTWLNKNELKKRTSDNNNNFLDMNTKDLSLRKGEFIQDLDDYDL